MPNPLRSVKPRGGHVPVTTVMSFDPPQGPFSEGERNAIQKLCSDACVKPVQVVDCRWLGEGGSCTLDLITLEAYFDSQEDAQSAATEAFSRSIANIRSALLYRPACAV